MEEEVKVLTDINNLLEISNFDINETLSLNLKVNNPNPLQKTLGGPIPIGDPTAKVWRFVSGGQSDKYSKNIL